MTETTHANLDELEGRRIAAQADDLEKRTNITQVFAFLGGVTWIAVLVPVVVWLWTHLGAR